MSTPSVHQMLDFSRRVVVVTGAGKGIGAGIARRFAEAGANVVAGYLSSAAGAEALVAEIEATARRPTGRRAIAQQADVTCADDVERLIDLGVDAFGRLDVVINNAGIYPMAGVTAMTEDQWSASLDANLKSVFLVTRTAARQMIRQGEGGAIVNIASIEGNMPAPMHSHYATAKAGVLMHTRAAALELGGEGIRVNSVSPGLIGRPGIEEEWPEGVERWRAAAPLSRLGQPEDVADACLFLASPGARWITGTDLTVDGGVTCHPSF
ncbi:MAG: glucose 1-dehydrogenase [Acidobacteriota bacterium]